MEKILFINACVRPESRTRELAGCLIDCLGGECEEVNVTDGRIKPLDALSLDARAEKIREGDFSGDTFAHARQFAKAETVVIAAPFWGLSFPACLKAYFENILVSDLTFTYKGGRPVGLCRAERLFYVTTAGGALSPDFGFPYVRTLATALFGIPEVHCFSAEGLDIIGNDVGRIMQAAKENIRRQMQ